MARMSALNAEGVQWDPFIRFMRVHSPEERAESLPMVPASRAFEATGVFLESSPGEFATGDPLEYLRFERYAMRNSDPGLASGFGTILRKSYYALRPLMPVAFRKHLQRRALRNWQQIPFPRWPVDTTVEQIELFLWRVLLDHHGVDRLPFVWFWPDGCELAATLTHDVETAAGRDACDQLIACEAEHGFVSAFQIVPEVRYEVPEAFLDSIRNSGCEIGVHGLNHDGRLFDDRAQFAERVHQINRYLRLWNAQGFRSPVLYRNQEWLPELAARYDMSVPNCGHLDPQRGGCCTVRPYYNGDLLEIPVTTTQDYTLLSILNTPTTDLWMEQLESISGVGGLASFIVHPDYSCTPEGMGLYRQLLEHLVGLRADGQAWVALPREIDAWWRSRAEMTIELRQDRPVVVGPMAERARIAWAHRDGDGVRYELEGLPS